MTISIEDIKKNGFVTIDGKKYLSEANAVILFNEITRLENDSRLLNGTSESIITQDIELKVDDYVEGTEYFGDVTQVTRGWVNGIGKSEGKLYVDIQADDRWNGARGTSLFERLGVIKKLKPKERPN